MSDGVLIDEKGEPWAIHDVARRLGCRGPDFDLTAYVVRNLGYIHLRPQTGGIRVSLCAGAFNLVTLTGALMVLTQWRPERVVLAPLGADAWSYRMFTSLGFFAECAEELAAGEPIAAPPRWLSAERRLDALSRPAFATVQPLVKLWEASRGQMSDDFLRTLNAIGLLHRTVLARQLPHSSRLIFDHFGGAITMMRPCETFQAVGRDLDDVPDREYGSWVAQSYAETLMSRRLRLDSVRARLLTSKAATIRVRYDRLLMPWRRSSGDLFMLGVSMRRELSIVA